MELSIATPIQSNPIPADLLLAGSQTEEGNGGEEIIPGRENVDGEIEKELGQLREKYANQPGLLKGESKPFTFTKDSSFQLPKLQDYLSDLNRPQLSKTLDFKGNDHKPSFDLKTKEIKSLEPQAQHLDTKQKNKEPFDFQKTEGVAKEALEKGRAPQSAAQLRAAVQQRQHHTQARTLENKVRQEEAARPKEGSDRKNTERQQAKIQEQKVEREGQTDYHRTAEKNEEREQQRHKEREEEEEGFAGGQQGHSQQDEEAPEREKYKAEKIDETRFRHVASYAGEESILSEIFKMRISQFDVLILFIEILKIEIKSREQERIERRQERELQIQHMQKVVENFKEQASSGTKTGIGAGVLGIASGLLPIIGHIGGDWIIKNFGSFPFFSMLRDGKKEMVFKNLAKICGSLSEMQKGYGEIHSRHSEGSRTYDQHMSDIYRTDWEERTRSIDEIKDSWKGIENFLYQTLQMQHETIRQLYNM